MMNKASLLRGLIIRGAIGFLIYGVLVFSTGTIHFWQGWALLVLQVVLGTWVGIYFFIRDPQVLERRLLRREKLTEQKLIILFWRVLSAASIVIAGYDHRFGWSGRFFVPVPLWLEVISLLIVSAGYTLHIEVLKANRFAASIIHVEEEQSVMETGPYRLVRHPMYVGFILMGVFSPLALGSFIAFSISTLIIPLVVFRLLSEEKLLRRDLPGYAEYCQRTPYRLIPSVW
jgi:protein-S-isoprenylcysteine O-methyltransferase Ste14